MYIFSRLGKDDEKIRADKRKMGPRSMEKIWKKNIMNFKEREKNYEYMLLKKGSR